MKRHWQRKPLLIRAAWQQPTVLDRAGLFALAARDDVESRVVLRQGSRWSLSHGPFKRSALPPLSQRAWTLLVQGVDLHVDAAHELMHSFNFVPWARLDDVMLSFATDGGGVGPHTDAYDVFLLQLEGSRRWRVGPVDQAVWQPKAPLKLLKHFEPTHDWLLGPGDMLYVPPGWGHDGVAEGPCITASVGFRAPRADELARALLARLADDDEAPQEPSDSRYQDPRGGATGDPGAIPKTLKDFAKRSVLAAARCEQAVGLALGEWLTEPKANVVFEAKADRPQRAATKAAVGGVVLDRRTRLLYDERWLFINGESFEVDGSDAQALKLLANRRQLPGEHVRRLSASAQQVLASWVLAGWLHADKRLSKPM